MTIILEFNHSIKRYISTVETFELELLCPCCRKLTRKHGKYKRTVNYKTKSYEIPILRRRCAHCKKTFSLIPSFIVPWGRFANHILEFFLRLILAGIPMSLLAECLSTVDVSIISLKTLYRWKTKYLTLLLSWWKDERQRMVDFYHDGDQLLALYRKGMNSAEEFHLLLSFLFGGHQKVPRKGKLFSAIRFRQSR